MNHNGRVLTLGTIAATLLLAATPGAGQDSAFGRPSLTRSRKPTVSPYLNLLSNGENTTAGAYYGIIRPQKEFRATAARQAQETQRLQSQVDAQGNLLQDPNALFSPTGHATAFQNHRGYFFTNTQSGARSGNSQSSARGRSSQSSGSKSTRSR